MAKTPDEQREWQRNYQRKRKASFKAKGICLNCQKREAATGKTCCIQCLEDKKLTIKFGTAGPYRQIYGELFEAQQGLCGICHQAMPRPVLDHNHETMAVRGLLCSSCNNGLGQFKDDPKLLKSAFDYVSNNAGIGISYVRRAP